MEKRRIFAWIAIIAIPLMLIISIILSLVESPIAPAFLMITLVVVVVLPVSIYLLTKYPKHIAEMFTKVKDKKDKEKE